MNDFELYLSIGWEHILNTAALDHLLFIAVLVTGCKRSDWRKILVLITGFTIGHSLTLALATYRLLDLSSIWVEFMIPLTIVLTSVFQLLSYRRDKNKYVFFLYFMSVTFGLIHGLGFAGAIRDMLMDEQGIAWPLFSFNCGIELAQLLVVLILYLTGYLLERIGLSFKKWSVIIGSLSLIIGIYMCAERWPF